MPSESEEQSELYLQAKRKRIAEWIQTIATGGKVSKFPSEVEEKQKRQSQHSDSHSVHKKTEKAAKTSMSTPKKKTGEDTIPLQKRYRPYVKCQECGTLQKTSGDTGDRCIIKRRTTTMNQMLWEREATLYESARTSTMEQSLHE